MATNIDRLYDLLPAVIRTQDAERGYALRDLLRVIGEERDLLEDDIRRMYANLFIETCEDWVVPYIGDLVGYRRLPVPGEDEGGSGADDRRRLLVPRRMVADTITLRRRKGTKSVLDDVVAAATGWPADISDSVSGGGTAGRVSVRLWRLPSWPLTRVRPYRLPQRTNCFTLSVLGNDAPLYTLTDSWDATDPATSRPVIPVPIDPDEFRKDPGVVYGPDKSVCLFDNGVPIPVERITVQDLSGWTPEPFRADVFLDPSLGRVMFPERPNAYRITASYHYGFAAAIGGGEYGRPQPGAPVSANFFRTGHLTDRGATLRRVLIGDDGAVTRFLRALFPPGFLAELPEAPEEAEARLCAELNTILQAHDLAAELVGQGLVDSAALNDEAFSVWQSAAQGAHRIRLNRLLLEAQYPQAVLRSWALVRVSAQDSHPVITTAIRSQQEAEQPPLHLVVELTDSGLYSDPVVVELPAHHTLELRAADGCRPTIALPGGDPDIDDLIIKCGTGSHVELDGLMVANRPVRITGHPADVTLRHCTLVPGWSLDADCRPRHGEEPSLIVTDVPVLDDDEVAVGEPDADLPAVCVQIDRSILGSIVVQRDEVGSDPLQLFVSDSIVDATERGLRVITAPNDRTAHAVACIRRSTIIGRTDIHAIELAENSLFMGVVRATRRQLGCLRYSFLPSLAPETRTPRRHACQPDLATAGLDGVAEEDAARAVQPVFIDPELRYGRPEYCRLDLACPVEIRGGADDGSEMGVFHSLFEIQREANLRSILDDYLPLGWNLEVTYEP